MFAFALSIYRCEHCRVSGRGAPAALGTILSWASATAAISTGTTQLIQAGTKKASNTIMGETLEVKEQIREGNEKFDIW